ncbi:putative membrane protein [Emiliania huxleyi virus 145]|nr:putative membrane protein [Emiliania huxleyi virus 145]
MAEGVAESIPVPKETEPQKLQRERTEREETSKLAGDDIWNIVYYAGIVLLGIIVMMVINSEGFQFLKNSLGKMVGAAASVMDFIGKNPWLLFLLPLIAPLFRFLSTMGSRFGSPEGKKQAGLIDKLFTDAKFKGRNVGFSARVRAEYANFTPDQKAYLNGKLEQMKTPIDSKSLAEDIEARMPDATVEAKANAYSQQMVVMKKNQADMVFSDLIATMGPDNPRSGPSNLLIEGTINSAQNAGDMLRSGKPVSKVDVQNVFMAVTALKKAESALRASYKDGFDELKADIESTGRTMESEMKLRERIAVLNNTDAITDPDGKNQT